MGGSRGNVSLYQTLGENENIQVAVQGHFQSFLKLMNSIMIALYCKIEKHFGELSYLVEDHGISSDACALN